jgi:hypothetical protein
MHVHLLVDLGPADHADEQLLYTVLSLDYIISMVIPMSDHVPLLVDLGPADHADEQLSALPLGPLHLWHAGQSDKEIL